MSSLTSLYMASAEITHVRGSFNQEILGDMEISTQITPLFDANRRRTRWSSTVFSSTTHKKNPETRTAFLVFAIDGPVTGQSLQDAVTRSTLPSTAMYPVGLLSSQIATIISEQLPTTVIVTGKGIYVSGTRYTLSFAILKT